MALKYPILLPTLLALMLQVSCTSEPQEDKAPLSKVYVKKKDDGYTLIRNGEPFFIKGACGNQFLKELKEAGANTVRLYDTTNLKQVLDSVNNLGLAAVIDIPLPRFEEPDTIFSNKRTMNRLFKDARKFVNTYKDHPAILYWMLGNEISYPDLPGDKNVTENFNALIDMIHEVDNNHPISTAVGGFDRSKILSIQWLSNSIDLISINIFGELSSFKNRKDNISLLWNGPYVLSELGTNGPWEAGNTLWEVPIEETSTKKAEQFRQRYDKYISSLDDGRHLGSLFFYWGYKQERTHTWFSSVHENGKKTQSAFEFENSWTGKKTKFEGPRINYALLNRKGAQESIILGPVEEAEASLLLLEQASNDQYNIEWSVRPENWNYGYDAVEKRPEVVNGLNFRERGQNLTFVTPEKEGPYRLFVSVEDQKGYIATTNIPFYILDAEDE